MQTYCKEPGLVRVLYYDLQSSDFRLILFVYCIRREINLILSYLKRFDIMYYESYFFVF